MLARLFLAFILVPLLDLILLIRLGEMLGFWPTVALVIATAAVGATLARQQGLRTVSRIQSELAAGRLPTDELLGGAMILVAGAVLLTPGFVTDLAGIALLIPPIRRRLGAALTRSLQSRITVIRAGQVADPSIPDGDSFADDAPPADGVNSAPKRGGQAKYVKNEAQ